MLFPKDLIASDESLPQCFGLIDASEEEEATLVFCTERLLPFAFFDITSSLMSLPTL